MGTIPELTAPPAPHPPLPLLSKTRTPETTIHLTGFSRFHNVPINPTEQIIQHLPNHLSSNPLNPSINLSTQVLQVAAKSSLTSLQQIYSKFTSPLMRPTPTAPPSNQRLIFVHLGVNVCAKRFQLELQAKNEATFSCPDELGWAPVKREIDANMGDLSAVCRTTLKVDVLLREMCARGYNVEQSTDAGRFVCNWVYFNSLRLASQCGAQALFVHVPPADIVDVTAQTDFIAKLLDVIAEMQ